MTVTTEEASTGNIVDQSTCSVTAVSATTLSLSTTSSFVLGVSEFLEISWTTTFPLIVGDIITVSLPLDYMEFISTAVVIYYDGPTTR